MTDIDTQYIRDNPHLRCSITGDEADRRCVEEGCGDPVYAAELVNELCDEIDALRAKMEEVLRVRNLWAASIATMHLADTLNACLND